MSEEGKSRGGAPESQYYYGTFQGVANYNSAASRPPAHPVVGFPQPVAPSGSTVHPQYYSHGYQPIAPGYGIVEGRPIREHRLPCCGVGMGWFLFIIGFFLGGIPWYVASFVLLCAQVDYREKPGYVACVIASVLAIIAVTLGATKGTHTW